MARIRAKDTRPELLVRKLLHSAGYRYRVHARSLPGQPDIVFTRRKKAVFVHGCFWHRHSGCSRAASPATRAEFWNAKFARNVERDRHVEAKLLNLGWSILVIWECETKRPDYASARLFDFLGAQRVEAGASEC